MLSVEMQDIWFLSVIVNWAGMSLLEHAVLTIKHFSLYISLAFGTLYPAYSSYKAVKTKNVKEYVSIPASDLLSAYQAYRHS